jgi:hypothetical protein
LVEKAETVQVHFTLEGEGIRAQEIIMNKKSTWDLTWQTMDNGSWSTKILVRPTSKR